MSKSKAPKRNATRKTGRVKNIRTFDSGHFRPKSLVSNLDDIGSIMLNGQAEQIIYIIPAFLLVDYISYNNLPGNSCLDVAHTLRFFYLALGIEADLMPVRLEVRDKKGSGTAYGDDHPEFQSNKLRGHCVLRIPQASRFIDATIGQFPKIAKYDPSPLIAFSANNIFSLPASRIPQGSMFIFERGPLSIEYVTPHQKYYKILDQILTPEIEQAYFNNSLHVLSHFINIINNLEEISEKVRSANFLYLNILLDFTISKKWDPQPEAVDRFIDESGNVTYLRDCIEVSKSQLK